MEVLPYQEKLTKKQFLSGAGDNLRVQPLSIFHGFRVDVKPFAQMQNKMMQMQKKRRRRAK